VHLPDLYGHIFAQTLYKLNHISVHYGLAQLDGGGGGASMFGGGGGGGAPVS